MKIQRATAYVDLKLLEENYRKIKSNISSGVSMLCVIKADAYGHGAAEVGRRLESLGVDYFGVATTDEGRELREHAISAPILVMSGIMPWEDPSVATAYDLTPAVSNLDMLQRCVRFADGAGSRVNVHLKVDTGMGRLGFNPVELERAVRMLQTSKQVRVEGVMSHFASSEQIDAYGVDQVESFKKAIRFLHANGIEPAIAHMANSGAVCNYPEAHFSMVRVGIMLYGSYPDSGLHETIDVKPVMRLASRIALIREFPADSALSYGRTFITRRAARIAYIPVGYADGYPRALSNNGYVLVRGTRCSIAGRICMDWLLADVTGIGGVETGEEVILMGTSENECISADEIAARVGTIPYEVLCGISKRIERVYV